VGKSTIYNYKNYGKAAKYAFGHSAYGFLNTYGLSDTWPE
jgi:hypothetical protein